MPCMWFPDNRFSLCSFTSFQKFFYSARFSISFSISLSPLITSKKILKNQNQKVICYSLSSPQYRCLFLSDVKLLLILFSLELESFHSPSSFLLSYPVHNGVCIGAVNIIVKLSARLQCHPLFLCYKDFLNVYSFEFLFFFFLFLNIKACS